MRHTNRCVQIQCAFRQLSAWQPKYSNMLPQLKTICPHALTPPLSARSMIAKESTYVNWRDGRICQLHCINIAYLCTFVIQSVLYVLDLGHNIPRAESADQTWNDNYLPSVDFRKTSDRFFSSQTPSELAPYIMICTDFLEHRHQVRLCDS